MTIMSWEFESPSLHIHQPVIAAIAQLVEHDLAKVGVASSSLVCRSSFITSRKRVSEVYPSETLSFLSSPLPIHTEMRIHIAPAQ